jgi:spore germination protein YaaH
MKYLIPLLMCALFIPQATFAASSYSTLEVGGWVPYFKGKAAPEYATKMLEHLDFVYPFVYGINSKGALVDHGKNATKQYKTLTDKAQDAGKLVIPTVMTGDGDTVHKLLSSKSKRTAHIKKIIAMVEKGDYDGVDIDYEGKYAKTNKHFSSFLKELKAKLGDKILSCTIEPRTPASSLYRDVPKKLEFANDYKVINDVCDRVNIMAYDQQRADLKLNDAAKGLPYAPVSDSAWVDKVVKETIKTIDADKIYLGIPTYGYEWQISVEPEQFARYTKLWTFGPRYGVDLARDLKITPTRNTAGEIGFSYIATSSKQKIDKGTVPKGTLDGDKVAKKALSHSTKTGEMIIMNFVTWQDSVAVEGKLKVAQKYGLPGVAFFRVDGGEDLGIWNLLK